MKNDTKMKNEWLTWPAKFSPEERLIARQIAIREMEKIKQNPIIQETQKFVLVRKKKFDVKIRVEKVNIYLYSIDLKISRKKKELFHLTQKLFYPGQENE